MLSIANQKSFGNYLNSLKTMDPPKKLQFVVDIARFPFTLDYQNLKLTQTHM
jgi:hypothetical protein